MSPLTRLVWLAPAGGLILLGLWRGRTWPIGVGIVAALVVGGLALRRHLRLRRARATPLSPEQRSLLETRIWFYRELDPSGRERFEGHMQELLATVSFEAVGGAAIDDEVRVLALAGAAVLQQGQRPKTFHGGRTILIYPDHFDDDYTVSGRGEIAGMVHRQGPIIFSRSALIGSWSNPHNGYNVAIHEFAHVLDLADGYADGVPALEDDDEWAPLIKQELARVRARRSLLRDYAGTNQAELFAVAVECYFEQPARFARKHPELFAQLRTYFS